MFKYKYTNKRASDTNERVSWFSLFEWCLFLIYINIEHGEGRHCFLVHVKIIFLGTKTAYFCRWGIIGQTDTAEKTRRRLFASPAIPRQTFCFCLQPKISKYANNNWGKKGANKNMSAFLPHILYDSLPIAAAALQTLTVFIPRPTGLLSHMRESLPPVNRQCFRPTLKNIILWPTLFGRVLNLLKKT